MVQVKAIKAEEAIATLTKTNEEIEAVRQSQAAKIADLLNKLEAAHAHDAAGREKADEEFERITEDLTAARKTIEQLKRSEDEVC